MHNKHTQYKVSPNHQIESIAFTQSAVGENATFSNTLNLLPLIERCLGRMTFFTSPPKPKKKKNMIYTEHTHTHTPCVCTLGLGRKNVTLRVSEWMALFFSRPNHVSFISLSFFLFPLIIKSGLFLSTFFLLVLFLCPMSRSGLKHRHTRKSKKRSFILSFHSRLLSL